MFHALDNSLDQAVSVQTVAKVIVLLARYLSLESDSAELNRAGSL